MFLGFRHVVVSRNTDFSHVESFDLNFFADANRRDQITDLEPHVSHDETKYDNNGGIDRLHDKLGEVTIEQAAYAIGPIALHESIPDHAIPTGTIRAVGKYSDG